MSALLSGIWPYIAAVIGALGVLWRVYAAGQAKERAKTAEADKKARDVADEVQNDVGAMSPAQRREELRKWGHLK